MKTTPAALLGDIEALGFLFEALCERDLRIYAESFGATLYHYQEYRGQEMDAVVELPDGQWCISTAGWSLCGSVMTQAKETAVVAF